MYKFDSLFVAPGYILLTLSVLLLSACGGSDASPGPVRSPGTNATGSNQAPPPRSQVDLPPSAVLTLPSGGANGLLGGAPDYAASDEVATALKGSGLELSQLTVLVLPVTGTDESILIIKLDDAAALSSMLGSADGPLPQMKALANVPALKARNVTRVAMLVSGSDKQGPYTATVSLPMSTLDGLASGALTSKDAQKDLTFFLDRGVKP